MNKFFEISKANMACLYRLAGLPEGEAVVFPVIAIETNMIGGKGFDAFLELDTSGHPELQLSKVHVVAVHRGRFVDAPVEPVKAEKEVVAVVTIANSPEVVALAKDLVSTNGDSGFSCAMPSDLALWHDGYGKVFIVLRKEHLRAVPLLIAQVI
jgi:hypothetical protein